MPNVTRLNLVDAVLTYRYLRITMVAVLVMLGFSVLYLALDADCWLGSVSAYYYTPVRGVFVASLVTFGAALIAYHAPTLEEEALLNLAGAMSIVVAFVPTTVTVCHPEHLDPATAAVPANIDAAAKEASMAVDNNIWALVVAALLALLLFVVFKFAPPPKEVEDKAGSGGVARWTWWAEHGRIPLAVTCAAILAAGFAAFFFRRDWFITHAHSYAAMTMVGGLILYMIFNAVLADHSSNYRRCYHGLAFVLFVLLVWTMFVGFDSLFGLEFAILGIFAIYWIVQSIELRGQDKSGPASEPDKTESVKQLA